MNRKLCVLIAALACAPAAHGNIFSWVYRRPLVSLLCSTALGYAVGTQTAHPLAIACAAGTGMAGIIGCQKRQLQVVIKDRSGYPDTVFYKIMPRYKVWLEALSYHMAEMDGRQRGLEDLGRLPEPISHRTVNDITYPESVISSASTSFDPACSTRMIEDFLRPTSKITPIYRTLANF